MVFLCRSQILTVCFDSCLDLSYDNIGSFPFCQIEDCCSRRRHGLSLSPPPVSIDPTAAALNQRKPWKNWLHSSRASPSRTLTSVQWHLAPSTWRRNILDWRSWITHTQVPSRHSKFHWVTVNSASKDFYTADFAYERVCCVPFVYFHFLKESGMFKFLAIPFLSTLFIFYVHAKVREDPVPWSAPYASLPWFWIWINVRPSLIGFALSWMTAAKVVTCSLCLHYRRPACKYGADLRLIWSKRKL